MFRKQLIKQINILLSGRYKENKTKGRSKEVVVSGY
jgi:hypothetical protein